MSPSKQWAISKYRVAVPVLAALLLSGCATFSADGGFGTVESITKERLGQDVKWVKSDADVKSVRATVEKLLGSPLTPEAAVQIALLNNRELQATYAELGIAEADLVQAGRLRNPGFSFARLRRGDEVEIDRLFLFDLFGLITMPVRTDLERRRFEQTKVLVAGEVLRVAAAARRAYFDAISAQQAVSYMEQVRTAAEAGADLARQMASVGNFSRLDQAREQAFYAETTARLARVRQAALAERERLTRLMGLWGGDTGFRLPERLPDLPKTTRAASDIETLAMKQRLDVRAAMQNAENIAASLGLVKVTGFINVLDLGYQRNSASGLPRQTGYEIDLQLPIFDWGGARVVRAEQVYRQAVDRAAAVAINARSEVRTAYAAYRTAFDLARHYRDEIVPLQKKISEENLLRYNGMLVSVFELLADARQQVASVNAYIEALRDFWVADSELQMALTGTSTGSAGASTDTPMAAAGAPVGTRTAALGTTD